MLERTLRALGIADIPNGIVPREVQRLVNNEETHPSFCSVKFPFKCSEETDDHIMEYDITFDVIDGEFTFLICLLTLLAMRAALNFNYKTLGLHHIKNLGVCRWYSRIVTCCCTLIQS